MLLRLLMLGEIIWHHGMEWVWIGRHGLRHLLVLGVIWITHIVLAHGKQWGSKYSTVTVTRPLMLLQLLALIWTQIHSLQPRPCWWLWLLLLALLQSSCCLQKRHGLMGASIVAALHLALHLLLEPK